MGCKVRLDETNGLAQAGELAFAVEREAAGVLETIARLESPAIAYAAYYACLRETPGAAVRLSRSGYVLAQHGFRARRHDD